MDNNFTHFIKSVDIELKKAEKNYKDAKKSAEEVAATSRTSWSQGGDRFHSQGTADLAKQRLDAVQALRNEVEEKKESVCHKVNGEVVFLVDNPIYISGFKIVSVKSPLGIKLRGAISLK